MLWQRGLRIERLEFVWSLLFVFSFVPAVKTLSRWGLVCGHLAKGVVRCHPA